VVLLAVGLCLPPLKALVPLVRASRTTVRAAIDHHGGGSKPRAAAGVLTRLSRISRLDRGLLMACVTLSGGRPGSCSRSAR
jgi:putative ABC transport system permease protein